MGSAGRIPCFAGECGDAAIVSGGVCIAVCNQRLIGQLAKSKECLGKKGRQLARKCAHFSNLTVSN